jgi:hypothetical protein
LLDKADEAPPLLLDDKRGPPPKKPRTTAARQQADESDEQNARFQERMDLAAEFEGLLEALFRDFLHLRLGAAWDALVLPAINAWIRGETIDADAYAARRKKTLKNAA